ncbi:DUF397 domain-containing protein [Saccharopolyspora shandongensis]|uniref:DUF397 domain-containing protein n=1 Tax=Saccharopolyspora shandongensis TaxID=418495 RepID=UPI0033C023B2
MKSAEAKAAAGDARFRKSSRSSGTGNCIMIAGHNGDVLVQDSKEHADQTKRTTLGITRDQFTAFIDGVNDGRFQR